MSEITQQPAAEPQPVIAPHYYTIGDLHRDRTGVPLGDIFKEIAKGKFPPRITLPNGVSGFDGRAVDAWCSANKPQNNISMQETAK